MALFNKMCALKDSYELYEEFLWIEKSKSLTFDGSIETSFWSGALLWKFLQRSAPSKSFEGAPNPPIVIKLIRKTSDGLSEDDTHDTIKLKLLAYQAQHDRRHK